MQRQRLSLLAAARTRSMILVARDRAHLFSPVGMQRLWVALLFVGSLRGSEGSTAATGTLSGRSAGVGR